jgi:hypothetical protein
MTSIMIIDTQINPDLQKRSDPSLIRTRLSGSLTNLVVVVVLIVVVYVVNLVVVVVFVVVGGVVAAVVVGVVVVEILFLFTSHQKFMSCLSLFLSFIRQKYFFLSFFNHFSQQLEDVKASKELELNQFREQVTTFFFIQNKK